MVFLWQNCSNLIPKTSIQGILSTSSGLPDTRIWFAQSRFSGGEKRREPNFPTSAPFVLPLKRGSLRDKPNANFLSPLHLRLLVASWALFIFGRKQSKKPDSVEEIESDCFPGGRSTNKLFETIQYHFRLQPLKSPLAF